MLLNGLLAAVRKKWSHTGAAADNHEPSTSTPTIAASDDEYSSTCCRCCGCSCGGTTRRLPSFCYSAPERGHMGEQCGLPSHQPHHQHHHHHLSTPTLLFHHEAQCVDSDGELTRRVVFRPIFSTNDKVPSPPPPSETEASEKNGRRPERIQRLVERFKRDPEEAHIADGERCCICLVRRASICAYPCGHKVCCRLCIVTMIQSLYAANKEVMHCVLCRAEVSSLKHRRYRS